MTHSGQPVVLEFKEMGGDVMVAVEADDVAFVIAVELRAGKSRHR